MTISFPHIGNYSVAVEVLLRILFPGHTVLVPPPTSKKTIELGAKHSPEFVCVPFKYNLGNMIEALEMGADTLIVIGGGCRYGYYGELQEQILRDLGYKFTFFSLYGNDGLKPGKSYASLKKLGIRVSFKKFLYALLLTVRIVMIMDKTDIYIRENIGFEAEQNSFENLKKDFYARLKDVRTFAALNKVSRKYNGLFKKLPLKKPDIALHVGIVGELYTVMDPFANYFMEKELAKYNIRVSRYTDVTYLLFKSKKRKEARNIRKAGGYVKYFLGADGTHSVAKCFSLAKSGCDGVIHVKPFGCTPEINAMPALININRKEKIPVLFFSFDAQTSETGVKTRLEAFYDMLRMKRQAQESAPKTSNR